MSIHEARFYTRSGDDVVCGLCSHRCKVRLGERGKCGVRLNKGGTLYSLVYGELVAENVDPIEKKPLFHVLPGSKSLSISTVGCNFTCRHCQNNSISQIQHLGADQLGGRQTDPDEVVEKARLNGCSSISYTYVEPTIFYEFAYDCSVTAKDNGIKNVFVSNGYLSSKATRQIAPYLDAINIDIKSFSDHFYNEVCGAKLQPVLDNVMAMKQSGVWVEITTLVIPGHNDSDDELRKIASFIRSVDSAIPWHVTAFHPMYDMTDRPPTPLSSLTRARQIGIAEGLKYVYEGNMPGKGGENTQCNGCGETVIHRHGFTITKDKLRNGACPYCSVELPGVWV